MQMKILGAGVLLVLGWLWFYLFVRQFLFNFFTAYPLIKKMQAAKEDLIAVGAKRYTGVSVASCAVVWKARPPDWQPIVFSPVRPPD